jgi:hypothetical protein
MLFCDADDIPGSGWAAAMESALRRYEFVACRLDFEQLNPPSLRTARQHTQATALQQFRFLPFPHAGAGTLGITRVLHEAVGGFDEAIPICEDVEITVTSIESSSTFQAVDAEGATCKINMGKTSIAKKLLVGDKLVVTRIRRFSKDGTYYTERFQDVYNKVKELTDGR